jgi:hypothetical protein
MRNGKIELTVGEIQGNLRQVLEDGNNLTAEQRYSLMAAIESMDFLRRLSPGLKKAMEELKNGTGKSTRPGGDPRNSRPER